jgi:hypothetical protein
MKKINVPAALKRHAEEKLTETERSVLFAVVDEHRRTGRNPVEISQRDIAKVVGISHQKVSRILELISVIRAADGVTEISGGKTGVRRDYEGEAVSGGGGAAEEPNPPDIVPRRRRLRCDAPVYHRQ